MKHLISLAMKYLRRQKFRTMLTFICITLSVFIFNLFCMAIILIRGVMMWEVLDSNGRQQVNLDEWIQKMPDRDMLPVILRADEVVDEYYINRRHNYSFNSSRDEAGYMYYFECAVDDHVSNGTSLMAEAAEGAPDLCGTSSYFYRDGASPDLAADEVMLSKSFEELGYQVGDTITITLTPKRGKLSEDVPAVQEMVAESIAKDPSFAGLPYFADSTGVPRPYEGQVATISGKTLYDFLRREHYDEIEFTDVVSGTPYSFTCKIAGFFGKRSYDSFFESADSMTIAVGMNSKFDFESVLTGEFQASDDMWSGSPISSLQYDAAYVTINDQLDFDDSVEKLYRDLGLPEEEMQETVHPFGEVQRQMLYNEDLLALQFRGMDAVTTWLYSDYLVILVILLALMLVFWALMRFVIDNAFEISVQERSAQFAVIRIMGASRRQVLVLVGAEALFYSVFAVSFGVVLAHLTKNFAVSLLTKFGITLPVTSLSAATAIGIVLALAAVFISAYTSSMWAARAYAPLEASKRSYLKSGKKETIWNKNLFGTKDSEQKKSEKIKRKVRPSGDLKAPRKSKLDRSRGRFLLNYTMRNIRRTRRRFLIAVITMTIGCGLFSFGISTGAYCGMELTSYLKQNMSQSCDFYIIMPEYHDAESNAALRRLTEERFADHPDYAVFQVWSSSDNSYAEFEPFRDTMQQIIPAEYVSEPDTTIGYSSWDDSGEKSTMHQISIEYCRPRFRILSRRIYENEYAKATGVSYDELLASGAAIALTSIYGDVRSWSEAAQTALEPPEARYPAGYTPVQGPLPQITLMNTNFKTENMEIIANVPICGVYCGEESDYGWLHFLIPEETAAELFDYPLESNPYYTMEYSTSARMILADSTKYTQCLEDVQNFCTEISAQLGTEVAYENLFYAHSGLKATAYSIAAVILIVLIAVWLTGIFTMVNTINTGVLNRCDELTMLRMIGMSQKQIRKTVSLESKVYCGISTLIGGILGISASLYAARMITMPGRNSALIFATMFGALLITVLLNLLIAHTAAKPGLRALRERQESGRMMQ